MSDSYSSRVALTPIIRWVTLILLFVMKHGDLVPSHEGSVDRYESPEDSDEDSNDEVNFPGNSVDFTPVDCVDVDDLDSIESYDIV